METKEQKFDRLNKTIQRNQLKIGHLIAFGTDKQIDKCWKEIEQAEQQLKELKNTVLICDEIQELTPEEYKRQTEKGND